MRAHAAHMPRRVIGTVLVVGGMKTETFGWVERVMVLVAANSSVQVFLKGRCTEKSGPTSHKGVAEGRNPLIPPKHSGRGGVGCRMMEHGAKPPRSWNAAGRILG